MELLYGILLVVAVLVGIRLGYRILVKGAVKISGGRLSPGVAAVIVFVFIILAIYSIDAVRQPAQSKPNQNTTGPTRTPAPTKTPSMIRVAPDGSGDYATLEDAIDHAPAGATIQLNIGVYHLNETIMIDKPLHIMGDWIDGPYSEEAAIIESEAKGEMILYTGEGVLDLSFMTFRHQGSQSADVLVIQSGEVKIFYCRFTGGVRSEDKTAVGAGLRFTNTTKGIVEMSIVDENEIGIVIEDQASPTIKGTDCSRNGVGIAAGDEAEPNLEENTCNENQYYGILFLGDSTGFARKNEASNNGEVGIYVTESAQPTLVENMCTGNKSVGIKYIGEATGEAQKNTCSENLIGISVAENAQPVLKNNGCVENEEAGIAYLDESGGHALENYGSMNKFGIVVGGTANPTLEKNLLEGNAVGIWVTEEAQPILQKNECTQNLGGIAIDPDANPMLMDNNVYENVEEDVLDKRE